MTVCITARHYNTDETDDRLTALVDRIEKVMRPLAIGPGDEESPEYERMQLLYTNLRRTSTGDPLQLARRALLYEILYPVLHTGAVRRRLW